jgi:hypothetical protein
VSNFEYVMTGPTFMCPFSQALVQKQHCIFERVFHCTGRTCPEPTGTGYSTVHLISDSKCEVNDGQVQVGYSLATSMG